MAKAIIEECLRSTEDLLQEEWNQIESMKEENDGRIKVSIAYLISYKGNEQAVKTTLTYGRKVTEIRESIINPDQLQMFNGEPVGGAEEPPDGEPTEQVKKPRRKAAEVA